MNNSYNFGVELKDFFIKIDWLKIILMHNNKWFDW